jgi:peptidoglycan/LPS O-acetylase OafA/YrhL
MGTGRHQNNFNLLRLLLALLVLLSHAPELQDGNRHRELLTQLFHTLSFGELAVDGFFLLSGYLIVQSWDREPVPGRFLRKRMLRIYPGFIVASLVCIYLVGPLGTDPARYFRELSTTTVAICLAVLHGPVTPAVFENLPFPQLNGSMWTIMREFACYLAVLLLGVSGGIRQRRVWLALTVAGFAAYLYASLGLPMRWAIGLVLNDPIVRLASLFFAGGCFYLFRDCYRFTRRGALISAILLLALMFSRRYAELGLATFGAYLLFYFAFRPMWLTETFNKLPDISYGVYLYGWPVQTLLLAYLPPWSPWAMLGLACLVVLPVSVLSCYLVEQPMLKLKNVRRGAVVAGAST